MVDRLESELAARGVTVYTATPEDRETRGRPYAVIDATATWLPVRADAALGRRRVMRVRCCGSSAAQAAWVLARAVEAAHTLPPESRASLEAYGVVRDTSVPGDIRYSHTLEVRCERDQ